jgi:predicted TIM-barrel fold metal-dependent hydrolase
MKDIPFVDAHVHFWDLAHLHYDWLTPPFSDSGPNGNVAAIAQTYLPRDYLIDAADWAVAGIVHVDAGAAPDEALAETEWLERQAGATGLPTGIIAFADLADPAVDAHLAAQAAHSRVRGIRQIVNWHPQAHRTYTPRDLTVDEAWQHGFTCLARHGLSFDLQCYPCQMPGLARLFERYPEVPVFVNHLGMPVLSDPDGLELWQAGLAALAALPQVAIKISGVGFAWRDWDEDRVRPLILKAIDLFGADRAMFASDVPTDKLFGSLNSHLSAYHAVVADFSRDERRDLFGRNANRLYRLDLDLEMQS